MIPGQDEAKKKTDERIIQAEKFKAKLANPPGTSYRVSDELVVENVIENTQQNPLGTEMHAFNGEASEFLNAQQNLQNQSGVFDQQLIQNRPIGTGVSDDDFFHLMAHIDPLLKQKIERGEFVDLDKLLPRDWINALNRYSDDSRMEWVQRDGGMFLVPARRESRITGFRKWEQAFRMYATIYCSENPHRAREIWQYVSIINTASSAYVWENVYSYDITFRQLMAFNPSRSWAVTYNQMWNLSMREPLHKSKNGNFGFNQNKS